jgi:hypothetical protein
MKTNAREKQTLYRAINAGPTDYSVRRTWKAPHKGCHAGSSEGGKEILDLSAVSQSEAVAVALHIEYADTSLCIQQNNKNTTKHYRSISQRMCKLIHSACSFQIHDLTILCTSREEYGVFWLIYFFWLGEFYHIKVATIGFLVAYFRTFMDAFGALLDALDPSYQPLKMFKR